MRRYRAERQFHDDGQLGMAMHVKLGGGHGQDNLCRIHFRILDEPNRHVRHLTTPDSEVVTSRTSSTWPDRAVGHPAE